MTYRILLSQVRGVNPPFDLQVSEYSVELKSWREHMARVSQDEANGVTGIERHWPLARPGAHPMVEKAVNENDEPDFEIVDDGPTPEQLFAAKKAALFDAVGRAEQLAYMALLPAGKRRLLDMRESSIVEADSRATKDLLENEQRGLLQKTAELVGWKNKEPDIAAVIRKRRPAEDQELLENQARRRSAAEAIQRIAAQAQHDIEDLTIETIDAWQMPDFNAAKES